jgi:lipid-A-disaccharide synthase
VRAPRILMSAGEPSGDLHGSRLARALRKRWPGAQLYGLGGPRMRREGVELLAGLDELAVLGFAEIVRHLPFFLDLLARMRRELREDPPDLVVPIDYPGFNLRLARSAKRANVPVLYYIAPQVWAWHRSRITRLAHDVDRLAVILPFEEALFREAGAHATFVGHPLLEDQPSPRDRAEFCASLGLDADRPILALFPGSRVQEVGRHLPLFAATASLLRRAWPELQAVIAAGAAVPDARYATAALPRTADTWSLLRHARAALIKSGTGTLQAALTGTPLVIAYRMHPLSYRIARRLVDVPHIGLVNLVAGERIAAELVQHDATPVALAAQLAPLLDDTAARATMRQRLGRVRGALVAANGGGTAERVAGMAADMLAAR